MVMHIPRESYSSTPSCFLEKTSVTSAIKNIPMSDTVEADVFEMLLEDLKKVQIGT